MKRIFLFLSLVIMLSGCKKKDDDVIPPIYFSGITMRDINAELRSADDTTDWRTGDNWTSQESKIFDTAYQTNCAQQHANKMIVYPNPCTGIFYMNIDKLPSTRIEVRVVDKNFNKLVSIDSLISNNVAINSGSTTKDTIRVYYKFIEGNCEFRGHGDILVK